MRNVKENQVKKCIFMGFDEFKSIVESLTDGLETAKYDEFGIYYGDTEKATESDTYWNEETEDTLSKYFDVTVASCHPDYSDDGECIGVWICCKDIASEKNENNYHG